MTEMREKAGLNEVTYLRARICVIERETRMREIDRTREIERK